MNSNDPRTVETPKSRIGLGRASRGSLGVAGLLALLLPSCESKTVETGGNAELIDPTRSGEAFNGVQCGSIRPPTEPDLMGWDAGSRARLKTLHEQGVVAVRYKAEGCNVELELLNCVGEEKYGFSPYSANETKTAATQQELFAKLPIGAAELGGRVGGGRALRTDYLLAGVKTLPVMRSYPAKKLRGSCDRATHVVSSLYIGGFAMAAGSTETLGATATIFGAGAEVDSQRRAERLVDEGDAAACKEAQSEGKELPLCSVPLRVGLTPIEGRAEGACPRGAKWDGKECLQTEAVTEAGCPDGTVLRGDTCVVVVVEPAPRAPVEESPPPRAERKPKSSGPPCLAEAEEQVEKGQALMAANPSRAAEFFASALRCKDDSMWRAKYAFALERQGKICEAHRQYKASLVGLGGRLRDRVEKSVAKYDSKCP